MDEAVKSKKECEEEMQDIGERVEKLYTDVYLGEGKNDPPITLRLDRVETAIESMTKNSDQLRWAIYSAIILMIANIIASHINFKF
jgi:hypothetical protein